MSAIVQIIRELVKAGLSGDDLLAAIDRVEASLGGAVTQMQEPTTAKVQKASPRRKGIVANPHMARAVAHFGTQHRLASAIKCSQQHISKAMMGDIGIAAEYAIAIEKATDGAVTRSQLRPDLWPEDAQ